MGSCRLLLRLVTTITTTIVPIPKDLERNDGIEHETQQKSGQDHLIVHFLQRGEHSGSCATQLEHARNDTQLTSALVLEVGVDLRQLAGSENRNGQRTEQCHHAHVNDRVVDETVQEGTVCAGDQDEEDAKSSLVLEEQEQNDQVLHDHEHVLAVGAERERQTIAVEQVDRVTNEFEKEHVDVEALDLTRSHNVHDLRHLQHQGTNNDQVAQELTDDHTEARGGQLECEE